MSRGASALPSKTSFILYLSRPLKAFILRFSLALCLMLALLALFVSKIDSPFTRQVKLYVADTYASITSFLVAPINAVSSLGDTVDTYFFVHSENKLLKNQNQELSQQLAVLSQVKVENERLRSLLSMVEPMRYRHISTTIVGDASGPYIRSILVDKGTNGDILKGQAVMASKGLIGRVTEVGSRSARVLLLTDIHSKIPVITALSRHRAIMAGKNQHDPQLLYLSKDAKLIENEEIVTTGDGNLFPPNLPIGVVTVHPDGGYFVKPYVAWHELEHVSVLMEDQS